MVEAGLYCLVVASEPQKVKKLKTAARLFRIEAVSPLSGWMKECEHKRV